MKHLWRFTVLGVVLSGSACTAFATPITPGQQNLTPTVTTPPGGTVVATDSGTLTGQSTFAATYDESVIEGGTGSLCPACLAFEFSFDETSGPALIEELAVSDYLGFTTDADYLANSTLAPTFVSETADGTINYNFKDATGTAADSVIIFTNATSTAPGFFSLQDSTAGNAPDLGPSVVPEPSSLFLLGTGLLSAAAMLFRKQRATAV